MLTESVVRASALQETDPCDTSSSAQEHCACALASLTHVQMQVALVYKRIALLLLLLLIYINLWINLR